MLTGVFLFGAILTLLGVGSHATGIPHLFYIFFLAIAKVLAIGIFIGVILVGLVTGWWLP